MAGHRKFSELLRPKHWPAKDTPKAERVKRETPGPKLKQKGRQRKNRRRKAG